MAVTEASFLVRFPNFQAAGSPMIQAVLVEAELEIDVEVWDTLADTGILWLAAHKLASSPFGQNARLVAKDGSTVYGKEYARLQRLVSSGWRVA